MSSQSGSEVHNNRSRVNRSKKTKAEPVAEKKSRRSNRKNVQFDDSENALPENIPISDSDELIIYHSYELEVTKGIIQIPISMFKSIKMRKEVWTRVGEIIIELLIMNNQVGQLIVSAKLKIQESQSSQSIQKNQPQNKDNKKKTKSNNGKMSQEENQSQQSFGQEAIYLVWGKVCWIGAREVNNKTIKQSPKTINTEQYSEIIKIKTKDVNSDIFVVLNMKKKIECVTDYNGLINQGNTCYMNSYLQMLSHIAEFKNLVFEANIVDENKFPATLQLLFHKLDNQQKPVSPEQLVKSFGWSKKQANIQQDAQEFSCLFYDVLERKLQEACPDPKHMSMSEMFEGKLINIIECLHVGNVLIYTDFSSQISEPFFNLSLSLSNNLSHSLDDYVAEQVLSEDNLYQTELYGPQIAKKSVKLLSLPPILMVQLKRFQFNYTTGRNEKIMQHFEYPNEIDFSKWQISSEQSNQYQLYAVLVHEGLKAQSGHYYAFVKIKDEWYRFNDQEVSSATNVQVFQYNFGGQIDVVDFDVRDFKVFNRKTVASSTAYMLVYVKKQLKQRLLDSDPIYPQWLKTHEIAKQQQREQIRIRKNFYHDTQVLEWQQNFKDCVADYLGFIPKDAEDFGGRVIDKLVKSDKVEQWVKPYNQKGVGAYVYLTTPEKVEYQTLINCQHRKNTFQELIRDPNPPIFMVFLPIIAKAQNLLYVIKMVSTQLKVGQQGEQQQEIKIRFNGLLEINRNSKNSQLLANLKEIYEEPGFVNRYFYQQKKQLVEIKEQNCLIKGPLIQRNILGIIIVQKIQIEKAPTFKNCTINWYSDLKNFVEIYIKSEDGQYELKAQMDQNRSVESLREYIFDKLTQDESCPSSDNIVLKAKLKKTAKNYVEVTGAKTIRDLLKNCDKENIIMFGFSNLKADERINQIEVKFMYRFSDFSYSEVFHVVLDRKSQNQSFNIYQKISEHEQVQKFRKSENLQGIRIFLFSKDKNVINDIITQNGYVPGKGEIAHVLQKERASHLVVEGYKSIKIEQKICPILLHHRSQSNDKIGIPRYLEFERSRKLTEIYQQILELIKDETYDWQQKKVKVNPMKVTVYAYNKDYNKGIYLADQQTLMQFQIEQQQKDNEKSSKSKQKDSGNGDNNIEMIKQIVIDQQQNAEDKNKQIIIIDPVQPQKVQAKSQPVSEGTNKNNVEESSSDNQKQNNNQAQNKRKNSKCEPKLKSWDKTIDMAFPKAKSVKIVIHHLYITKAQTAMKIKVE